MKKYIFFLILVSSGLSFAQSRRAPEIRSCLSSEFAYAALEFTDASKNLDENYAIGEKIGYVIGEYYQEAIWAMDNPEVEGRDAVMFANQSFQKRMKSMSKDQLWRDVQRCRKSFGR